MKYTKTLIAILYYSLLINLFMQFGVYNRLLSLIVLKFGYYLPTKIYIYFLLYELEPQYLITKKKKWFDYILV